MRVLLPPARARRPMSASLQGEDGVDAYCVFFTSGHLDSDSGCEHASYIRTLPA
jgi:hypothetical protein